MNQLVDVVNWSKSAKGMYRFEMKEDEQGTWIRALWGHTFANLKIVSTTVKKVTLLRSSDVNRRQVVKMLGEKEKERIRRREEHLEEEEMKRGGRRPGSGSPGGRLPDDEAFSYLLSLCFFFLCSLFSPEASVSFHDDDGYALRASFEFFFRKNLSLNFFFL